MATIPGWTAAVEFPYPPANGTVYSPYISGTLDLRWDDPSSVSTGPVACGGRDNSTWDIVGVNIYRSDTGERGPYIRVNNFPVGTTFFRDQTDNRFVENEIVDWETQWISKGDAANNSIWRFRTRFQPIVKREGQAILADSVFDVLVTIDGQSVPVDRVFGPTGEIDLINRATYDPSTEKLIQPLLPNEDGTSVITVSYWRKSNVVLTSLDHKSKIFYRLTSVAVDATGLSPTGYTETPLGYSPPISPMNVESLDYMWAAATKRNMWILEQGGERVKVFIRRETGVSCPCQWDERLFEFAQQPYNRCAECYGTGFITGYEGPFNLIIAPDDSERKVSQTVAGRRAEHMYEVWTSFTPAVSQRDFIVKQTGERYSVGPVRHVAVRGRSLQQHFNIALFSEEDIRYKVPIAGSVALTWPAAACAETDPYPTGPEEDLVPMTEMDKIPAGREQRGRTKVYANITYGGRGDT